MDSGMNMQIFNHRGS